MPEWHYWCLTDGWQRTGLHCSVCKAYFPPTAPIRLISDRDALAMALELADIMEADQDFMEWDGKVCLTCWLRAQVIQALRKD